MLDKGQADANFATFAVTIGRAPRITLLDPRPKGKEATCLLFHGP